MVGAGWRPAIRNYMIKKLKANFKIWDTIFANRIHCYIGYSGDELSKLLERQYKYNEPVSINGFGGLSFDMERIEVSADEKIGDTVYIVFVIWLRRYNWTIDDMATLIHEISHTIDKMFDYNNIPLSKDTGEFRAVLAGDIYGKIAQKIRNLL